MVYAQDVDFVFGMLNGTRVLEKMCSIPKIKKAFPKKSEKIKITSIHFGDRISLVNLGAFFLP